MADLTLRGFDGANPLGFMAALGVLAVFESERATLRWEREDSWRPVLTGTAEDVDALVACLDRDRLSREGDRALSLEYDGKRDLKPPPGVFRRYLLDLLETSTPQNRVSVDWAASFATDVAVDNNGNTKPTALHFTAGQQQFLQMAIELVKGVTCEDLREATEGPWRYERALPVMGWDSTSSRDYALRASDPSTDKKRGVPGADWLALRGLTFLAAMPVGTRVATAACAGGWKSGTFQWPIWTIPLPATVVRSLLCLDLSAISAIEREARGIGAVFLAGIRRSGQGGYGSFEPASVV